MSSINDTPIRQRALRRVKLKMAWLLHATVYLLVNLGLAAIDLASGGRSWHLWPLAGWGLGLAIHGILTLASLQGDGLRERMLEREMARLRGGR